jgi:hypothetical protein
VAYRQLLPHRIIFRLREASEGLEPR